MAFYNKMKRAQLSTIKVAIIILALVIVVLLTFVSPIGNLLAGIVDDWLIFGEEPEKIIESCGKNQEGVCYTQECIELVRDNVLSGSNPCSKGKYCCGKEKEYCPQVINNCKKTCSKEEAAFSQYYCPGQAQDPFILCCLTRGLAPPGDYDPPKLTLTSFNEGEYIAGETYKVTWTAVDEKTEDGAIGINYLAYREIDKTGAIIFDDYLENTGSYDWTIPVDLKGKFKISIMATDINGYYSTTESSGVIEIIAPEE